MDLQKIFQKYQLIPSLDLDLLLSHTLHKPKEFLFAHPEYELSLWEKIKFTYFLHRYKRGIPIAYIIHHKEFFGLDFFVNKHTLIPRPDTEVLVEEVIKKVKGQKSKVKSVVMIDVGTGSGCIPISIIKTLKHKNIKAVATDISKQALKIAKKNAKYHEVELTFLRGNLLEPVINNVTMKQCNNETIIITANLPYLTHEQFISESSIQYEPYSALVAPDHGLGLYKQLLKHINYLLTTHNVQLAAFFEIDPSQTSGIISEIKKILPEAHITVKQDLAGRDRVVYFSPDGSSIYHDGNIRE